ncbi:YrrS family protein [Lysinibacillus sp. 54212]|uniref:YrrS family protein n=1 Tax=Lysinibacillus sp. 54212 TaxID=3119829 RepID=UPI002FC879CA
MTEEENKLTKRSQQTSRTHRRNLNKMDKTLNYLIAIVSILIVITLMVIFIGNDDKDTNEIAKEQQENTESPVGQATEDDEQEEQEDEAQEPASEPNEAESEETETTETEQEDSGKVTVNASTDPIVKEVWQNESWQPYTTAQSGSHVSTFKKGHIDYEEKLGAIYSAIPLAKEDSILLRVQNNGNASSAIAVVTSKDKQSKYRVSIQWVDGQGWKPILVEVLNSLEGAY